MHEGFDGRQQADSITADTALYVLPGKKNYLLPAAEVAGSNIMLFSFDRFVISESFSRVTLNVIKDNIKTGFVWDNDAFYTNLLSHPYNGSMYFNMARANGLPYYESMAYCAFGSLTWELFAENEPPAIQDWFSTTFGGACIGEVSHRISQLFLDDQTRGFPRFIREGAAMILNPVAGIHRLLRGEATKIRHQHYLYHDYDATPVDSHVSFGGWYLADNSHLSHGHVYPYFHLGIAYGDPIEGKLSKPFDYFQADLALALADHKPLVNTIRILGNLLMSPAHERKQVSSRFGLFQHFNYFNSDPVKEGSSLTSYRLSEALGLGPGWLLRFSGCGSSTTVEQQFYADAVIMGGVKSDYYSVAVRDYNMGSGFSLKTKTLVSHSDVCQFELNCDYFRLFTWKGWEHRDLSHISPVKYNIQGDKSNAEMIVLTPTLFLNFRQQWGMELSGSYFFRQTRYAYHDDAYVRDYELRIGLSWRFSEKNK
jgi:hypothetical protein